MANYITNKIIFNKEHKEMVLKSCFNGENFDFNTLIPQPLQMYRGNLSIQDSEEFKCNWYDWNIENWGTKSNACDISIKEIDDNIVIQFDTAWSPPTPILVAFGNKLKIPFKFMYKDECDDEWIEQEWIVKNNWIRRVDK